jgi:hypothetical protein
VIWLIKFAMRAMMPRTAQLPGIEDTDVDAFLRRMRREAATMYWMGLVLGTWVFMLTPLLTVFLPLPAFLLPKKLLARHADKILASNIYLFRQATFLIRLSAGMCWGADPAVRAKFSLPAYGPDPGTFRKS